MLAALICVFWRDMTMNTGTRPLWSTCSGWKPYGTAVWSWPLCVRTGANPSVPKLHCHHVLLPSNLFQMVPLFPCGLKHFVSLLLQNAFTLFDTLYFLILTQDSSLEKGNLSIGAFQVNRFMCFLSSFWSIESVVLLFLYYTLALDVSLCDLSLVVQQYWVKVPCMFCFLVLAKLTFSEKKGQETATSQVVAS